MTYSGPTPPASTISTTPSARDISGFDRPMWRLLSLRRAPVRSAGGQRGRDDASEGPAIPGCARASPAAPPKLRHPGFRKALPPQAHRREFPALVFDGDFPGAYDTQMHVAVGDEMTALIRCVRAQSSFSAQINTLVSSRIERVTNTAQILGGWHRNPSSCEVCPRLAVR